MPSASAECRAEGQQPREDAGVSSQISQVFHFGLGGGKGGGGELNGLEGGGAEGGSSLHA